MAVLEVVQSLSQQKSFSFLIVCCLLLQGSGDLISVFPSDTETRIGQTATLYCRVNHAIRTEIEWHHTPYGLQKNNAVYLDGIIYSNYRGRFTVSGEPEKGECNLVIASVSLEDAGKYRCMHKTVSNAAELIVFATFPSNQSCSAITPRNGIIGSNVCELEPDNIILSCNYSYRGNKVPVVEWKNATGSILESVVTDRADVHTSTRIHKAFLDEVLTCYIKYPSSDIQSKFSWTVPIKVLNILHNDTIQNTNCDSKTVNCANARLPYDCKSSWTSSNGSFLSNTTLSPTNLPNGLYICSAQCNIRGKRCSVKQLTAAINCSKDNASTEPTSIQNKQLLIGITVPAVFVLILVSLFIVIWKRFWRRITDHRRNKTQTAREKQNLQPPGDTISSSSNRTVHDSRKPEGLLGASCLVCHPNYDIPLQHDIRITEMQEASIEESLCNSDNKKVIAADVYDV